MPGSTPLKPNIAAGFAFCGFVLSALALKEIPKPIRIFAAGTTLIVIAMSALTLVEHFFHWDLGIDNWLVSQFPPAMGTSYPGRMQPTTAFCFLLTAIALLAEARLLPTRLRFPLVGALGASLVIIGTLALGGFLLELALGPGWNLLGMSLSGVSAGIGFLTLGAGLFALLQSKGGLKWSLGLMATSGFVLGAFLVVLTAGGSSNFAKQMLETNKWVSHREEVLKGIQEVTAKMAELASSEQIYAIVGNENLLKERQQTRAALGENLETLRKLTVDNPNQQGRLNRLGPLIAQRIDWEERLIAVRREQGLPREADMIANGPGLEMSDRILGVLKDMERHEYRLLAADRDRADSASIGTFLLLPMGLFLSVAVLSFGVFFLNSRVAEEKQAQIALRQSEARYRNLFERNPNPMWIFDRETLGFLAVNSAAVELYGYSQEEFLVMTITDIRPQEDVPDLMRDLSAQREGPTRRTQWRHRKKNGSLIEVEVTSYELNWLGRNAKLVLINDITVRKRAEEALRKSEAQLHTVVENLDEGVIVSDLRGRLLHWNPAALDIHGLKALPDGQRLLTELVDTFEISTADGQLLAVSEWPLARVLRGEHLHDLEVRVRNVKAGWNRILNYGGTLVHDANSQPLMAILTSSDITERKKAEELLLEQSDIISRAHDAMIIRNFADESITFWNKGAEELYGWSADEAIGKNIGELIFADEKEREIPLQQLRSTGDFHGELKQVAKDGREIFVDCRGTLVRNQDGTPRSMLLINNDVTQQKKLEMQLLRSQRLETIGTLASGVAHDLNNILTPILMCAETLQTSSGAEDRKRAISMIEQSALRGASVVKQVLTFARGIEGKRVRIKASHLIEEMVDIARKTFPKVIEIRSRYTEDVCLIEGDPTQLHQVLLNLSINARDAMPRGGVLTLSAEDFIVSEDYVAATPGASVGSYLLLCVTDTGTGMPRETIDKIFDPFFTTKEIGKGTGLGLSTALGIVKSHGGFISVYSEPEKGTSFRIFLPAAAREEEVKQTRGFLAPLRGNGEQILVVDDEPGILQMTKLIFEKHDYRVVAAKDGKEALTLFEQQDGAFGGVLTDVSMPNMDGISLVRALKKMKPGIPVIASTGQGDDAEISELQSLGVKNFLTKPYNIERLLATMHQTLQGEDSPPQSL